MLRHKFSLVFKIGSRGHPYHKSDWGACEYVYSRNTLIWIHKLIRACNTSYELATKLMHAMCNCSSVVFVDLYEGQLAHQFLPKLWISRDKSRQEQPNDEAWIVQKAKAGILCCLTGKQTAHRRHKTHSGSNLTQGSTRCKHSRTRSK